MSELNNAFGDVSKRISEFDQNPSELTRDGLLVEIRAFYDLAKKIELPEVRISKPMKIEKPAVVPTPTLEVKDRKEEQPAVIDEIEEPVSKVVVVEPEPVAKAAAPVEKPKKEPLIGKDKPATKADDNKTLAGKFNQEPLTDLRAGIPLNEKFGIIRNLFKGNASDFGDAVLKLNNAANSKEMTHYLELLSQRFEWDLESVAYQSFVGYVNRKMLTLEASKTNAD